MNFRLRLQPVIIFAALLSLFIGACDQENSAQTRLSTTNAPPPKPATSTSPTPKANAQANEAPKPKAGPQANEENNTEATKEAEPSETSKSVVFEVDQEKSKVEFFMEAPLENIHGVAKAAMEGEVTLDLYSITNSQGTLRIDLDKLEVFQAKRRNEDADFAEEVKNDTQNEHMRTWFQISDDAPPNEREANRWISFTIIGLVRPSTIDLRRLTGETRVLETYITGDFHLHGHTRKKSAFVEATFHYDENDEVTSIDVASLAPVKISLLHHDIRPRTAFDKLAQRTLSALGQKVAREAPVTFAFTLKPKQP